MYVRQKRRVANKPRTNHPIILRLEIWEQEERLPWLQGGNCPRAYLKIWSYWKVLELLDKGNEIVSERTREIERAGDVSRGSQTDSVLRLIYRFN